MASKPPKGTAKGKTRTKAKGNVISDGTNIPEQNSVKWSDEMCKKLMLICREYQRINVGQQFSWVEITKTFQERTEKFVRSETVKNKFDHMKRIWSSWNDLRYKETGCGWNSVTGLVTASDEWWEKKLKENDKYKRFRKKGVEPATSELWDQVFGEICATGRHCVSPSMDPSAQTALAIYNHQAPVVEDGHDNASYEDLTYETESLIADDQRLIEQINQAAVDSLNLDEACNDDILESVVQIVNGVGTSSCPLPSRPAAKKTGCSSLDSKRVKKKSKSSASTYDHLERLDERGEKLLNLFQEEINSSSVNRDTPMLRYEYDDCWSVVKDMMKDRLLQEGTETCFLLSVNSEKKKAVKLS